jgi:riboflavin kinase / FMN adenylyltransferase
MRVYSGLSKVKKFDFKTAVTIGVFDGVHLGHQRIIKNLNEISGRKRLKSVVVTFSPHPASLSSKQQGPLFITTLEQRLKLISELGIDICLVAKFTKNFANQTALNFVRKTLLNKFNMSYLVVSRDYKFGRNARGDIKLLEKLSKKYGFKIKKIDMAKVNGSVINSTLIRKLISGGDLSKANKMLNRPYFLEGRVIRGKRVGSRIGFPTVNLKLNRGIILPAGVYLACLEINPVRKTEHSTPGQVTKYYKASVNVGYNPTLKKRKTKGVEAHILDYSRNLYRRKIRIHFLKKIREEKKFNNLEQLKEAIGEDIKKTRAYFRRHNCPL